MQYSIVFAREEVITQKKNIEDKNEMIEVF